MHCFAYNECYRLAPYMFVCVLYFFFKRDTPPWRLPLYIVFLWLSSTLWFRVSELFSSRNVPQVLVLLSKSPHVQHIRPKIYTESQKITNCNCNYILSSTNVYQLKELPLNKQNKRWCTVESWCTTKNHRKYGERLIWTSQKLPTNPLINI